MNKNINLGLLILRIAIGVLMLLHGIAKFKGITGIEEMLSNANLPTVLAYGVYISEIIAPILIIVGYRTRIAAAFFTVGVIFAIFLAHSERIFTLNQHGGWSIELLGLFFFCSITLIFTGGGNYAISNSNKWD